MSKYGSAMYGSHDMVEAAAEIQTGLAMHGFEDYATTSPGWHELLRDREARSWKLVRNLGEQRRQHLSERVTYVLDDAMHWTELVPPVSLHAIVTDPPYGVLEYEHKDHEKLRAGHGGIWRIPPSFDGAKRKPLPRFTILSRGDLAVLHGFFSAFARHALKALVPGGHVFIASNPLVSSLTFHAIQNAGFEKRGEIIRLVQTLRGGYKPKGSEADFPEVSVMPRSCWEPWGIFRKPFEGTVAQNLRRWGAGGLRRLAGGEPLKDVVACSPTRGREKEVAPHPSLKPQRFLRQIVRASLPLGIGVIYDPFSGSGSTLAAAEALGYHAIGTDRDVKYLEMGCEAFSALVAVPSNG